MFDSDIGKGPKSTTKAIVNPKKLEVNLGKGPEKKPKAVEKPHIRTVSVRTDPVMLELPCEKAKAPIVRYPHQPHQVLCHQY